MVRIIIFLILLYLVYRIWVWLRRLPNKLFGAQATQGRSARGPGRVLDEMKPCPQCGTYNPTQMAAQYKGLYFCDQRCHEAYLKAGKARSAH